MKPTVALPSNLPRSDRLLCHYFPESVRDYISNEAYLALSLDERGVMQTLRHYAWHAGQLPETLGPLSRLTRINEEALQRCLPGIIAAGFFVKTELGTIYCPELEEAIGHSVKETKRLKAAGRKGGEKSGEARREKAAAKARGDEDDSSPGGGIPF